MKSNVIPILRSTDETYLHEMAQVIVDAGFKTLELTLMHECVWSVVDSYKSKIQIVLGTVSTSEQVLKAKFHGIQYLLSPGLDEALVKQALREGLQFIPGVLTPTEIQRALLCGCNQIKLFPVTNLGGVSYLKSMQTIFPDKQWVVSGGIQVQEVSDYLKVKSTKVGMGSNLFDAKLIADKNFKELSKSLSTIAQL